MDKQPINCGDFYLKYTVRQRIKFWWQDQKYQLFGSSMSTQHDKMIKWLFRFLFACFLAIIILGASGCATTVAVVDVAASTTIYTGKTVVNTIDMITPDIVNKDEDDDNDS